MANEALSGKQPDPLNSLIPVRSCDEEVNFFLNFANRYYLLMPVRPAFYLFLLL